MTDGRVLYKLVPSTDFFALKCPLLPVRVSVAGESLRVGGTMVAESRSAKLKCSFSSPEKPFSRFSRTATTDWSPREHADT